MLLDCRLGDDQIGRDISCRSRGDEGIVAKSWLAERSHHVDLAASQLGHGRPARVRLRHWALTRQATDPAALRAERHDVAVFQQSLGYDLPVDARAVPR